LNLSTREKECYGIYFDVKTFEDLLDNRRFILKTDHIKLTYLYVTQHKTACHDTSLSLMMVGLSAGLLIEVKMYVFEPGGSRVSPAWPTDDDCDATIQHLSVDVTNCFV